MEIFALWNFYKNIKTSQKCLLWVQESLGYLHSLYGYTGKSFSSCKGQQGGEVESNFCAFLFLCVLLRVCQIFSRSLL